MKLLHTLLFVVSVFLLSSIPLISGSTTNFAVAQGPFSDAPTVDVEMTVMCPPGFQCPIPDQFMCCLDITSEPGSSTAGSSSSRISPFIILTSIYFVSGPSDLQYSIRIDPTLLLSTHPTPPGLTLELDTSTCSGTVDTTQKQICRFFNRYVPVQSPQG